MPDPITIGILGLIVLFVLLILRMPVGIAMIVVGIGGTYVLSEAVSFVRFLPYLRQFKSLLWENVANYDLSVVPLFVLMGYLAAEARLSSDLFKGLEAIMTRLRGGVAMAAIAACGGFGAVCGSSLATAATMGKVALPELKQLGYAPKLASGALAAGGTLGILIPPSVALVIYAIIVEGSILQMFQAAVLPGLMGGGGFHSGGGHPGQARSIARTGATALGSGSTPSGDPQAVAGDRHLRFDHSGSRFRSVHAHTGRQHRRLRHHRLRIRPQSGQW